MKISNARIWQALAVAAIICAFSSVAAATDFSIGWNDPPSTFSTYPITTTGVATSFSLSTPWPLTSTGVGCDSTGTSLTASDLCATFKNDLSAPLTSMELQFTVAPSSDPLIGQSISCGTGVFTANNCSDYSSLSANETVTLLFTGGNIPVGNSLVLALTSLNGATPGDFQNLTYTAGVPEPSSLLLLGAGLGLLALMGVLKKRAKLQMPAPVSARCS